MKGKIFDKEGRLFGVISVIDILTVIIVAALGCAVYTRFFTKQETAAKVENDEFDYTLRIEEVRSLTAEALKVGDVIYAADNDSCLGQIKNIEVVPAERTLCIADGTYKTTPVNGRCDVILSVTASGLVANGRCYADRNYEISVNQGVTIYSKYCYTSGTVWTLEP